MNTADAWVCVRQAVQQAMAAEYNESQMAAVTAGLDRSPVILIKVTKLHSIGCMHDVS